MSLYKISDIEKVYPDWFDPNHSLSRNDQQFIWENMPLPKEDEEKLRTTSNNKDINTYEGVNGISKLESNYDENLSKTDALLLLRKCNYKTAPNLISLYLERIFSNWKSHDGYWLRIAQYYTPKTINAVILQIIKQHKRGEISIKNPAAYFTYIIKFKHKRKKFRATNGCNKLERGKRYE